MSDVGDYWDEDGPEPERYLDDGRVLALNAPLDPGLYFSRFVEVADYDDDDDEGFVSDVTPIVETIRVRPQDAIRPNIPLAVRRVAYRVQPRGAARVGRRRRRRAARASPGRSDDPDPSAHASPRRGAG